MSPEQYSHSPSMMRLAEEILPDLMENEAGAQEAARQFRSFGLQKIKQNRGIDGNGFSYTERLEDTRVLQSTPVISPDSLTEVFPLSHRSEITTSQSREAAEAIIEGNDDRLLVVVGPCSIHDICAAQKYADSIKQFRGEYGKNLEIIMRFYTEKPRTVTGWKGFTYDPHLTEFFNPEKPNPDINLGLILTRMLANSITNKGVPLAMERLNALTPQYLNGLIAVDSIGARNALDQTAREYASGTSSIAAIKNPVDGSVDGAIDALVSASTPHAFLGLTPGGNLAEVRTTGNDHCVIVLRGGKEYPNYYQNDVEQLIEKIKERAQLIGRNLTVAIGVDTSHRNSGNDHNEQRNVALDVARQIKMGQFALKMVMIESNLIAGSQKADGRTSLSELREGQSITDNCIGISDTHDILSLLSSAVEQRRKINTSKLLV